MVKLLENSYLATNYKYFSNYIFELQLVVSTKNRESTHCY